MISFRRRQDAAWSLHGINGYLRVVRILLFGRRARGRPTRVLDRVPRGGPSHRERVAMGRRGI
jgi:hypothetical protein